MLAAVGISAASSAGLNPMGASASGMNSGGINPNSIAAAAAVAHHAVGMMGPNHNAAYNMHQQQRGMGGHPPGGGAVYGNVAIN